MTYPHDQMVREHNLKAENDKRQAQLLYWNRLRGARTEYADETGSDPHARVTANDDSGFFNWMQRKYGVKLEFIDGHISGAYTVVNDNKFLLFTLKYPR